MVSSRAGAETSKNLSNMRRRWRPAMRTGSDSGAATLYCAFGTDIGATFVADQPRSCGAGIHYGDSRIRVGRSKNVCSQQSFEVLWDKSAQLVAPTDHVAD